LLLLLLLLRAFYNVKCGKEAANVLGHSVATQSRIASTTQIFIARQQSSKHAQHGIVMAFLSLSLSSASSICV